MKIIINDYEPKEDQSIFEQKIEEALDTLFKAGVGSINITYREEDDQWRELK